MPVHFAYDSRDHHQPLNRHRRFGGYLLALFLLIAAVVLFYRYFTDWGSGEEGAPTWLRFMTGFVFGVAAALLIAFIALGFRKLGYGEYQYLKLDDTLLQWQFNKRKGPQQVAIADIEHASEDPRHLILNTKAGEAIFVENYLLIDPEEWPRFMAAVREVFPMK